MSFIGFTAALRGSAVPGGEVALPWHTAPGDDRESGLRAFMDETAFAVQRGGRGPVPSIAMDDLQPGDSPMAGDVGDWFSARVRLAARIGDDRLTHWMDCVHVFRAAGWDAAFRRALDLGRSHEEAYRNEAGALVRWTLAEVVSLDRLSADRLDGAEVYSEITEAQPSDANPPALVPEASQPTQTI